VAIDHGLDTSGNNIALTPKIGRTIIQRQREKLNRRMQAADIGGGPAALLRFMDTALERTMRSKSGPLAALLSVVADVSVGNKTP
jgi:hypothetical protein